MLVVKQHERVPRVRQRHVERVHLADADVGEQVALVAPVDLGLRAGDDLEPAMHPDQRIDLRSSASSAAIRGRASARNILTR